MRSWLRKTPPGPFHGTRLRVVINAFVAENVVWIVLPRVWDPDCHTGVHQLMSDETVFESATRTRHGRTLCFRFQVRH